MPSPREQDAGSALALLDPAEDMAKIDWFEFRNRAVSEAIIALCKVVKEETGGPVALRRLLRLSDRIQQYLQPPSDRRAPRN